MKSELNSYLKDAISNFNIKNFDESKKLIMKVLSIQPRNFDALLFMGVVLGAETKHEEAIKYFEKAIIINPKNVSINFNLANALLNSNKPNESLKYHIIAHNINPRDTNIIINYGKCLIKLNKLDEAINILEKATLLNNNLFEAWYNMGLVAKSQQKFEYSLSLFNKANQIKKDDPKILNYMGLVLLKLERFEEATKCLKNSLLLNVDAKGDVLNSISVALINQNKHQVYADYSEAREYAQKALEIDKDNIYALNNLSLTFLYEYKIDQAIHTINKAIDINPNYPSNFINLGMAYKYLNMFEQAEINFKIGYNLDKNNFDQHGPLSEVLLSQNKLFEGWFFYEFRKKRPKRINFNKPLWYPDLGYGKILLWGEQGVGDTILFSTSIKSILNKFEKIYILVEKRLVPVFEDFYPEIEVIEWNSEVDERLFDYHLSICSLGKYFRKSIEDFLNDNRSLSIKKNSNFLKKNKKLKCGISWGSVNPTIGASKSINLEYLLDILKLENIDFYNIQYTKEDKTLSEIYKDHGVKINNIEGVDTFNDIYTLLQFIDSCDFVVSVSNTNAHLSACIGKPTFLLLSKGVGKLWYWVNDHNGKNLWYPSVKKFIQSDEGEWGEPVKELMSYLKNY